MTRYEAQMLLFGELADEDDRAVPLPEEQADDRPPSVRGARLTRPGAATFDLVPVLATLRAPDVQRVAARFLPGSPRRGVADLRRAIAATLAMPRRLDALIARLSPLERDLLEELARRGGRADARELVTFAALRGHEPPPGADSKWTHGTWLGSPSARAYLIGLVEGGLLVRPDPPAPWDVAAMTRAASDVVAADTRLLVRLPERPVPPAVTLRLARADPAPEHDRHPMAVVLEFLDVIALAEDQGGITVTRADTIARPFLKRLARKRPHLGDRLETLLLAAFGLGLVRPPKDAGGRQPWPIAMAELAAFRNLPPFTIYGAVVDAVCRIGDRHVDAAWRAHRFGVARSPALWRSLLDALVALPDHPFELGEAADALWDEVLARVFGPLRWLDEATTSRPEALAMAMAGPLASLGLLSVRPATHPPADELPDGERDERDLVAALAPGACWYARARALANGHETIDPETLTRLRGLDPETLEPLEQSLLVLPNLDVQVYLDRLASDALGVLHCATVSRIDAHTATLTIDRWSLNRALEAGHTVDEVLTGLAAHASGGVPDNVAQTMRDWARRRDRLRVSIDTRIVEYHDATERDRALPSLPNARALGDRFAVMARDAERPRSAERIDYRAPPVPTMTVAKDGTLRVRGPLDLPGRAALAQVARAAARGGYAFDADAIRGGALTPALRDALHVRTRGGLPATIDVLLRAWSGEGPHPAIADATLFHHPKASAWAQHEVVGTHLATALSDSTYLVKPGSEAALGESLRRLGVPFADSLPPAATAAGDAAGDAPESALVTGIGTRKTRERLEEAIEAGHQVELHYAEERERYGRYGSVKRSKGRKRRSVVQPEEVVYRGSLPYLRATDVDGDEDLLIRIGYVSAFAVRRA